MKQLSLWIRQHWQITAILSLGFLLRFWRFWAIPYTHDELSALKRTEFSNFPDLIDGAVRLDGHPAGTQILLWMQSSLSMQEWWIKLPFLLAGVWSIWLIYLVAKRLFNEPAGLISAALLATLQYPITFSQWARPYGLGLAVILALAYVILRIRTSEQKPIILTAGFSILAALSGYIHYFSLLQAILVTIGFFPFIPRKKWGWIVAGSLGGFLLWLPHMSITLHHLDQGGIGEWLQPPTPEYWREVLSYAFQFSIWPVAIVGLAGIRQLVQVHVWGRSALRWMLLALAMLPFIIGYYYSLEINPLLHQSVLIFSFPFLVLWMVSFIRIDRGSVTVFALILCLANVSTLVADRNHYELNYTSEYQTTLDWAAHLQKRENNLPVVLDLRADLVDLLIENDLILPIDYQHSTRIYEEQRLQQFLDQIDAPLIFFGMNAGTNPEAFAAVLDHFPCIEEAKYFHVGEAYLLSRNCESRTEISKQEVYDEMIFPNNPYSSGWEWNWKELDDSTNTHFVASFRGVMGDATIVAEIKSDTLEPAWRGVQLRKFRNETQIAQRGYHVLYNSEMVRAPKDVLKSFVWLNNGGGIELYSFRAYSVPMNRNKYKLFRE